MQQSLKMVEHNAVEHGDILSNHMQASDERFSAFVLRQVAVTGTRSIDAVVGEVQLVNPRSYQSTFRVAFLL